MRDKLAGLTPQDIEDMAEDMSWEDTPEGVARVEAKYMDLAARRRGDIAALLADV